MTAQLQSFSQTEACFQERVQPRTRIVFGTLGVIAILIALSSLSKIYELISSLPQTLPGVFFYALVFVALSGTAILLFLMTFVALNKSVLFNASKGHVTVKESHLLKRVSYSLPYTDIVAFDIIAHDWTDGPSSYEIKASTASGQTITFGNYNHNKEASSALQQLKLLMDHKTL